MAALRGPRLQVASASWVGDERSAALQMLQSEVDEFSYSVRNEVDWLNEHMAGIINGNEINFAETFKTPGKLRGRTPHSVYKVAGLETRVPLSDVFVDPPNASPAGTGRVLDSQTCQIQTTKNTPRQTSPRKPPTKQQPNMASQASQDLAHGDRHDFGSTRVTSSQTDAGEPPPRHTATVNRPSRNSHYHEAPAKTLRKPSLDELDTIDPAAATFETATQLFDSQQDEPGHHVRSNARLSTSPVLTHQGAELLDLESLPLDAPVNQTPNDSRSPSEGSSPIQPVVRKSSLNFASLPAREPLTTGKSFGPRVSRTSHTDTMRTSHYNRTTGGKSLSNFAKSESEEHEAETDDTSLSHEPEDSERSNAAIDHAKTYTQRLQDHGLVQTVSATKTHQKSPSVSTLPALGPITYPDLKGLEKTMSISYPDLRETCTTDKTEAPPKSPSRGNRESPLKQVKNKLSSMLKSSRSLLASSAAASAEGRLLLMSPSTGPPGLDAALESDSRSGMTGTVRSRQENGDGSPLSTTRHPRASSEKEKGEKRREKEAKLMMEQDSKLDKAREKEREKVLALSKENETTNDDIEMQDAPTISASSLGAGQSIRGAEIKRPVKPTKEAQAKAKQAPTLIRVNMGSQQSQYQGGSQHPSVGAATNGRAKTLDLTARKREQEEREAQRRGDVKPEMERKRAALQEEQRKQENLQRQVQHGREAAATQNEPKMAAQRRAAVEKAKQVRAPPPAPRSNAAHSRLETASTHDRVISTASSARGALQSSRPQSRMASNLNRSQDETNRPANAVLSSTSKAGSKRALGHEDGHVKGQAARGGPAYQANDAKRRRTSAEPDDDTEAVKARSVKAPPVRPSGGLKKDVPARPAYGYTTVSHAASQRDLFKATVTAQHHNQAKAAHPLDMAQISKGAIPFAPTNTGPGASNKKLARPGGYNPAKSAAKSSPRFPNGDSIELPEIGTDDEDEDEDQGYGMHVAAWADSPDLRRALMRQETMDPSKIFGPAAPLNIEEVFSKSKHSFRARTSSANWSGADRLTEEEIRRDREARDRLRRDGAWSYEMSREMV